MPTSATCPACGTKVIALNDGKCPACRTCSFPAQPAFAPRPSTAMKTSADEYSARPGNDDPLESWAPPLRDPLSRLRKFLLLVLVVAVPLALAAVGLALHGRVSDLIGAAGLGILVGGTPILAFIVYLLPGRPVDAFYLRSFHNDSRSWPMRKAAQVGLGPGFRLSGIRDFHRRRSFLDYLAFGTFILRYCTPKFMNLEAGADWKKRLWRSLGDARCALIDISEMTPSVREEIALAYGSLGPNRVQFIGDPFRTVEEWEQLILKVITGYAGDNHVLNVAMWDQGNSKQKRIFCKAVRSFPTTAARRPGRIEPVHLPFGRDCGSKRKRACPRPYIRLALRSSCGDRKCCGICSRKLHPFARRSHGARAFNSHSRNSRLVSPDVCDRLHVAAESRPRHRDRFAVIMVWRHVGCDC